MAITSDTYEYGGAIDRLLNGKSGLLGPIDGRDILADKFEYLRRRAADASTVYRDALARVMHIRPTLVFGVGDLLLNTMAWALRRFSPFPLYGRGDYPVQPVYVEDLAAQAVEAGSRTGNSVADAARPDTISFKELLRLLASAVSGLYRGFLCIADIGQGPFEFARSGGP